MKLDCGILDSSIWVDRPARELFLTALLMAQPHVIDQAEPQIEVRSLKETGFVVPPGVYGLVPAAGIGIVRRAGLEDVEEGLDSLERLGKPEADSRSSVWDGRRLVRVNGGFIVLNFEAYRKRDATAAERAKRYRDKQKQLTGSTPPSRVTTVTERVTSRSTTASASASIDGSKGEEVVKSRDLSNEEEDLGSERERSTALVLAAKGTAPIKATALVSALKEVECESLKADQIRDFEAATLFAYWKSVTDHPRSTWIREKATRLRRFISMFGLETCLYAVDGVKGHPSHNHKNGEKFHELNSIFKFDETERVEKLAEYARKRDGSARHRMVARMMEQGYQPKGGE